jgi:ankyrin repeat protein
MADQRIPLPPSVVRVALSKGHKNPSRRIEVVKLLLASGADINGEGGEALRTAMRQEDLVLVKFLLEAGADVNASNEHNSTPLHYAAFLGEIEFARLFLQAGARLDSRNSDGKTPAQWAAFHGRKELAKLLQQAAQA